MGISNSTVDSEKGKDVLSSKNKDLLRSKDDEKDRDATKLKAKDGNTSFQLLHSDVTQEESLDDLHQNSARSQDESAVSLSETLNETTISSEDSTQDVVKNTSLEIIDYLEEKCEAKKMLEAMEKKLKVSAEGLEDTGDVEDDAVAVTDEVLTNIKLFNSRDDEEVENDAVEVTDNLSQCSVERNTAESNRSKDDILKEPQVGEPAEDFSTACSNYFKKEFTDGVIIPNTSDFHHDDIASSNDIEVNEETKDSEEEVQNPTELEEVARAEAVERHLEAERLHLAVVNQPGCPTTGNFAKAFGISANSIQVINLLHNS